MNNPQVKSLLDEGKSFGQMWMEFGQNRYGYDENFKKVSDYAIKSQITKE